MTFVFQLGEYAVEGADWSIEKFGSGVYMVAAKGGKILWEEVSVSVPTFSLSLSKQFSFLRVPWK